MGQYYKAALVDGKDVRTFRCWGFMKLMEHSYLCNPMVNQVMYELVRNPQRVFWTGDYAHLPKDRFGGMSHRKWMELFDRIWNTPDEKEWDSNNPAYRADITGEEIDGFVSDLSGSYLINHTKNVFVSLPGIPDTGDQGTVHPLPILTACGNLRGGGDYCGTHMELVGSWAGDLIEVLCDRPDGLTELKAEFRENRSI